MRHACRSLIKNSHAGALRLQGYNPEVDLTVFEFGAAPNQIALEDSITVSVELELNANSAKPNDQ